VNEENLLLLKTAALLHDIGYSITHDDVQILSEDMAREALPFFYYKPQQIEKVCRLMKVTHYESIPNGILEEIMHDANLMYFGRADFAKRIMNYFSELTEHGVLVNKTGWLQNQIHRLTHHRFYTNTAQKMMNVSIEQQIAETTGLLVIPE
jgi:hypothetical protein